MKTWNMELRFLLKHRSEIQRSHISSNKGRSAGRQISAKAQVARTLDTAVVAVRPEAVQGHYAGSGLPTCQMFLVSLDTFSF